MRSSQIILAVILVVALRGSAAAAQHAQQVPVVEWLQPRPSGNQINSIATHGSRWVAVGDAGTITLSTDAGATWKAHGTSTAEALRGVAFLDSLRLLAVGERGVVLESADGGQNWQARSSGTSHELRDEALSGPTAVIIGASGLVQRSANAGKTWRTQKSGVTTVLRGLATPTSNTFVTVRNNIFAAITGDTRGYAVGHRGGASSGTVYNSVMFGNSRSMSVDSGWTLSTYYTADPHFVDTSATPPDLHVQSSTGSRRNNTSAWKIDSHCSVAIDNALAASTFNLEPSPNGGRRNIGAYGNTPEASKSCISAIPLFSHED